MASPQQNTAAHMADGIDAFAVALRGAETFPDLREICIEYFTSQGLVMMSYHHLPPPGAADYDPAIRVVDYGFPPDWVALYNEKRLYKTDPIPRHALASTHPFWWSDARRLPDLTADEIAYLDALQDADFGDGLAVPVFGPFGRNGYAGLGYGKVPPELSVADLSRLQWAAQLGHLRYCDLLRAQSGEPIALSNREHEILEWVARGKSNSVIADITGLSTYTVDTYMRRIFLKFGVSDRVTAALRGLAIGMVA
jgi:LuxR family transcriptional regulator/LuxR family quorum-sensing system transcriptional regulator CciR